MMFPLLEYLDSLINAGNCSYQSKDVAAARIVLLRPTHMVDYAIDMHKELHPSDDIPEEMMTQKAKVYQDLESLKKACQPLADLAQNQEEKVRKFDPYQCLLSSSPSANLMVFVTSRQSSWRRGSGTLEVLPPRILHQT